MSFAICLDKDHSYNENDINQAFVPEPYLEFSIIDSSDIRVSCI